MKKKFMGAAAAFGLALAAFAAQPGGALAQEVTLRLHQFLPPQANVPEHVLKPSAESVGESSGGKLKVDMYSAMALGGKPPELMDQALDGVVDIVWTVVGYTPGRFPRTEVFELPFMMNNAEATSRAYWELLESEMKDTDFKNLKILGAWVHGPGVIHCKGDGVSSLEDMKGKKVRGPSRMTNALLQAVGAETIGLPVPAVPEALTQGVIDCTVIPYEVTSALKVPELVDAHTEFGGDRALYTVTFVLAMNKAKYESLTEEQKGWLDENSGLEFSAFAGKTMQDYDAPGKEMAVEEGNEIITIDGDELERWKAAAEPVVDDWIADMEEKGIDGQALIDKAKALIEKHGG